MPENLANASAVLLFGREVTDVQLVPAASSSTAPGVLPHASPNQILANQITAGNSRLCRVYAFAYEGNYYELSRPALFLVHGTGQPVTGTVEFSGVAATSLVFSGGLQVWAYDKADMSVRLDVFTGMLEEILLNAELNPESRMHYSGQQARIRFSGQQARVQFSGQQARMRRDD